MYSNAQIFSAVLNKWLQPIIGSVASAKLQNNQLVGLLDNSIRKYFPVSPNYSVTQELGWIIDPITSNMIEPKIREYVSKLDDSVIPKTAHDLVAQMEKKAATDGKVSFFEMIELEAADVANLKRSIELNMPLTAATEGYVVIE